MKCSSCVYTVKAHVGRILHKLDKESRTEAAVLWATSGWKMSGESG